MAKETKTPVKVKASKFVKKIIETIKPAEPAFRPISRTTAKLMVKYKAVNIEAYRLIRKANKKAILANNKKALIKTETKK